MDSGRPGGSSRSERAVTYCLIPGDLAAKLHDPLRKHFRDDPNVEVVVERRGSERRLNAERREAQAEIAGADRRGVPDPSGRRAGERRAVLVAIDPLPLPARARRHAGRLVFVERVQPTETSDEDLDTARLVARIQAGEPELFSDLYVRYFDRVYAYLRALLKDRHEAEDVTQQVFLKVLEALPRYERRKSPFRVWLFVIVRNHALNRLQGLSRVEPVDPAKIDNGHEPASDEAEQWALSWVSDKDIAFLVERLPLAQRQVLLLRYTLDLTHAEIAAVLGRSPDDVRVTSHRALRFLRERLVAMGRAPETGRRVRMRQRVPQATVLRARRFVLMR